MSSKYERERSGERERERSGKDEMERDKKRVKDDIVLIRQRERK